MSKILVGGVMSKGGTGQRVNEWGWSLGGTRVGVGIYLHWAWRAAASKWPHNWVRPHWSSTWTARVCISSWRGQGHGMFRVIYKSKKYFWMSRSMNVSCHFTKLTVNISHQWWVCIKWYINMYFSCTGKSHDILSIWWLITWSYTKMTLNCILIRYNPMLLHVIYIPQCI